MPRPARTPLIATALTMLLCGCDLSDNDKDKDNADDASTDDGADDESGESGGESDSGGEDVTGGGDGGTGEPLTPCQQCASVNCSEETMPCATDQTCQDCAFGDADAPACADNEAWQAALACACDVCPDECADIC